MSKIYKFSLVVLVILFSLTTSAQKNFFTDISETAIKATPGKHDLNPDKYRSISLDVESIKSFLWALPIEKNIIYNRKSTPVLSLPMPDGTIGRFNVWESSIQEPGLEAKFPEIKTFAGQGIDDPYATIRFDYSPYLGFHAQILSAVTGRIYIDPYARGNVNNYMSYYHKDNNRDARFECGVNTSIDLPRLENTLAGPCRGTVLTTYRLSVTCTGEYAQTLSGVTVGGANPGLAGPTHAGIVASANRVSGLYEQDLSIRLTLVANNNLVEFLSPSADPFANNGGGGDLNAITDVINNAIGATNYDIGHLFCTSETNGVGAGVAFLGVVCTGSKGGGLTGRSNPTGDGYDIDYVAHEMGHQFGANHTFNSNNCASSGGSYEPGGGTTIMAYAGICANSENIQPNSDPVFHAKSFDDISNFLANGNGGSCGVSTSNGNNLPVIATLVNNNLSIPINTPFTLSATATDADGDALTYNWEGWDAGNAGSWTSAANSTTRTLFRTRVSKINGTRSFPDIRVIAANYPGTAAPSAMDGLRGETLPQVARAMRFRLSVRDNRAGGGGNVSAGDGCQDATPFIVNAVGTTPFSVTTPNGGESYVASSTQTITWNNAATNAAPFNVTNVKISYSSDGGLTYPIVLIASTANDGTEPVTMPSTANSTSRIRIEAIGNIFFDISNANFILTAPPTDFNFGTILPVTLACPAPATPTVNIPTTVTGTFVNPITLATTSGVPAGTTVTFSPNPVAPGTTVVATLNNANTLAAGSYTIGVSGTATGASVKNTTITFNISAGAAPIITTNSAAATVCAGAAATFTVASSTAGVSYQWQSATSLGGSYTNIFGATSASYTTAATTAGMNGMGYHCIISTQCGTITSANALLTVNTAAAITTQPVSTTACTGATATFNVVATGTGATYQWQSATAAAGPWTNVGTNSASYTTVPLTITTPTFYQVIVTTTTCPATVTSTTATLGVSVTTTIGTQPVAQTVCAPSTATYTVAATGTGISYQWQMATAAAPTVFNNVGTNSNTFTTAATSAAMNGNIYRVVVTGSCNTVTSNTATLTVNTVAAITTQPTAVVLCNGVAATFTAAGSGTGVAYQWQSGPSATGPWVNVTGGTGATTTSYTTVPTIPTMNGTYYRMVATTTTCPLVVNSSAALLTVNTVAVIGTQPAPQSACIPQTATFTVTATGTGLTYQWQVAQAATPTVFADITGATSTSYTTGAATLPMNGNLYRVSILSTCSPTTPSISTVALLTVTNPVAISLQPVNLSGCIGDNFTFTSTATSPGNNITYQWQVSLTGAVGTFTNIVGASGTLLATANAAFALAPAQAFMNGRFYRVYYSVPCGTGISADTSVAAKLNISNKPTVVLTQPATSSVNPSLNKSLFTTISPATVTGIFTWTRNGAILPNTLTATSIVLPVNAVGKYQVKLKDANTGCEAVSNEVDVDNADNITDPNRVFVYPNPATSTIDIRYIYNGVTAAGTTVNIYDEKGAKVFSRAFNVANTLGRMRVDVSNLRPATYLVYIMDASGKKLASTKLVKVP
jgi:Metallo-peptidase family M12B Reprolysin-like/Secretion system C-terminal sorting domain